MLAHRSVTQTVPPTAPVLTLLEAKQQLRIDTTEDDALIENYIAVACAYCEHYTARSFVSRQFTAYYTEIPPCVVLPHPPAQPDPPPVVEIRDENNLWEVVDPAEYVFDYHSQPASICFSPCGSTVFCNPSCSSASCGSDAAVLRITWWAGYGEDGTAVPLLVKQAVALLTAHYYERRLASDSFSEAEIPFGVTVLLDSVRWRFYT